MCDMNFLTEDEELEADLIAYEQAMEEYRKNPKTYSFDEVMQELGISEHFS